MRRRGHRLMGVVGALIVLVTIAACGGGAASSAASIKIGILAPYTGVFATYGPKVIEEPIQLWLEQHDNKIAGRPVELIKVDDQSTPEGALRGARQLVEQNGVHAVVGLVNSAAALAVRNYLDQNKVVTIVTVAAADELTQKDKSEYIFRVGFSASQFHAAGAVLAKETGLRSIAAIADDYVAPRQLLDPFLVDVEQLGIKVEKTIYSPFPTTDYGPYLSQLREASGSVQAISPMIFGADSVAFFTQYQQAGFNLPLYTLGDVTEQTIFLDQVQDKAVGSEVYWNYSPWLDTEQNNAFREAFVSRFSRLPGAFAMQAYSAMDLLAAGFEKAGDRFDDGTVLASSLEGVSVDTPGGKLAFDADHATDWNVYLNKVVRGPDGRVAQVPMGPWVEKQHQLATVADAQAAYRPSGAPVSAEAKRTVDQSE